VQQSCGNEIGTRLAWPGTAGLGGAWRGEAGRGEVISKEDFTRALRK
jgi:hypothetical protein